MSKNTQGTYKQGGLNSFGQYKIALFKPHSQPHRMGKGFSCFIYMVRPQP